MQFLQSPFSIDSVMQSINGRMPATSQLLNASSMTTTISDASQMFFMGGTTQLNGLRVEGEFVIIAIRVFLEAF